MARYRKNTAQILFTDVFKGIDVTEGGKKNFSSSVYMKNFRVTEQGKLKKRCGYKKIKSGVSADSCYADSIGGEEYFIYKNGTTLNALRLSDLRLVSVDTEDFVKVGYFKFGGFVYIYGRGLYYRFDGDAFEQITPYIPTVAVSCSSSGGGTPYESLNIISDMAAVSYSPDGESDEFILPDMAKSVYLVELEGEEVDDEEYTYNSLTHTLTFEDAPSGDLPDSLKVTFVISDGTMLNMPSVGPGFCIYGGDRDTRVFSYGYSNVLRYSDVTANGADPTYFPTDNFITVGDGSSKITALLRHYDRLMVFTERETWFLSPSSVDHDGYSKPSFPLSPLNSTVGCAGGGAAYADNSPITLSGDGIYVFSRSTVRDERNAQRISDKVCSYTDTAFLRSAVVFDNEHDKEIWMCFSDGALIYNYGKDVFYYYDNVPARYLFALDGKVAFYSGEALYVFDQSCKTDDGAGICAVCESGSVTLDPVSKKRRLRRVCLSYLPEGETTVSVYAVPNRGEACRYVFYAEQAYSGLDFGHISFGSFTFSCGARCVHGRCRARLSSFESIGIRIESGAGDGGLSVDSVSLTADGT
ncbi:MAG: hypothetical protein IJT49_07155 [Clostridia bacterium]|nr:hypothetical protein [Clostridia bacterium]